MVLPTIKENDMDDDRDLDTRIQLGTLFLDETQPGWRDKIDILQLDVEDPKSCILGQLFEPADKRCGGYTNGSWELADWADATEIMDTEWGEIVTVQAGFERISGSEAYTAITRAWVEVIGR
jgi:hypothetical protein